MKEIIPNYPNHTTMPTVNYQRLKQKEKPLYGSIRLMEFDNEQDYQNEIERLKTAGFRFGS